GGGGWRGGGGGGAPGGRGRCWWPTVRPGPTSLSWTARWGPWGDGPRAQAVEAHAVPGRARARGERDPLAPVPPGPLPRAPPGGTAGPPRTARRRCRAPRGRAMIGPGRPEPGLTEPDLPRTAKVRPKALRTGWTTRTCASAAAKAAPPPPRA